MTKTAVVKGTIPDGAHLREVDVTLRYNSNEWGETVSFSTGEQIIVSIPVMDLKKILP